MTTFLLIAAIVCVIATAANLYFSLEARKMIRTYSAKIHDVEQQEYGLQVRHNALDRWAADLKDQAKRQAAWDDAHKHIYANVEVLDSAEEKPTAKAIGKSLSSKIGYALRKQFPDIQERRDDKNGGRTVYSVDFYVAPFSEQK